jgi:hypothetical protein
MSVVDDARVVCGAKLPDDVDKVAHVDLGLQPVLAQLYKPAGGQSILWFLLSKEIPFRRSD